VRTKRARLRRGRQGPDPASLKLDDSPARHVEPLNVPDKGKLRYLTAADLDALCAATPSGALGPMEQVMYRVTFETGMRLGEVVALRWSDIDWRTDKIVIASNGPTTGATSKKTGRRRIVSRGSYR
jgi:integrase